MSSFIIILILITAVLLMLVAALQGSKKEGMSNNLGNAGVYQIVGVKKTSDLLEQITWGLIIALFSLSLIHSIVLKKRNAKPSMSPNLERFQGQSLPASPQEAEPDAPAQGNNRIETDSNQ